MAPSTSILPSSAFQAFCASCLTVSKLLVPISCARLSCACATLRKEVAIDIVTFSPGEVLKRTQDVTARCPVTFWDSAIALLNLA